VSAIALQRHPAVQIILDAAERGQPPGVILIGDPQTASEVERRILANCAIGWNSELLADRQA
jgi:hypothetical protein